MIFQTIKNRSFLLNIALLAAVNIAFISLSYADDALYTLDLRDMEESSISLEMMAKKSEGRIVVDGENYVLSGNIKIISNVILVFSNNLYVNQWNLSVESPSVEFRNFSLKSFSVADEKLTSFSSGSIRFVSSNKTAAGDEIPLSVSGTLSVVLHGQKKKNGGSVFFPANANFSLNLEFDLRGGEEGGENGVLVYKINETLNYAYQPEGIRSVSLAEKELESFFNS